MFTIKNDKIWNVFEQYKCGLHFDLSPQNIHVQLIITTHDTDCNGRFQLGETVMERATELDVLKQE